MFLIIFVLQCYSWCKGVWLFLLIFTARDFFFKHELFPESPVSWCSLPHYSMAESMYCNAIELVISVKRVRVNDWCKASPLSVMTLLFIGPYFISSSVSGKSFPHGTTDTMMFIYSVHITCGQLNDLSCVSARAPKTIRLLSLSLLSLRLPLLRSVFLID